MSFGRPGGFGDTFKVSPPQRGSFPLDHDGESPCEPIRYPAQNRLRVDLLLRHNDRRVQISNDGLPELSKAKLAQQRGMSTGIEAILGMPDGQVCPCPLAMRSAIAAKIV